MGEPHDNLYSAFLAVQGQLPHLQRTKINPAFRSKYVPLEELHGEVLPILNEHGLIWITQPLLGALEDSTPQPCLHYRLIHAATGEEIEGTMPLLLDKLNPQGQGSAITYARRYALMAVLGLVADDDDDGNKASGKAPSRQPTRAKENAKAARAKAASKPQDAPQVPPNAMVGTELLAKIKTAFEASGLTPAEFGEILKSAGAGSTPISELPQEKAEWVLVALRERIENAQAEVKSA